MEYSNNRPIANCPQSTQCLIKTFNAAHPVAQVVNCYPMCFFLIFTQEVPPYFITLMTHQGKKKADNQTDSPSILRHPSFKDVKGENVLESMKYGVSLTFFTNIETFAIFTQHQFPFLAKCIFTWCTT